MRVLIVDDVAPARRAIRSLLEEDPEITVVGEAENGEEAVALALRLRPDVITMDVLMPVLDGYAATARIMSECPTPIVAVTSLSLEDGTVMARMIEAGAVDVMSKAFSRAPKEWERMRRELVHRVKAAARVSVRGIPEGHASAAQVGCNAAFAASRPPAGRRPRLVVVAASTGGPPALRTLLGGLEASLAAPVLVVQHISKGFTAWMAEWLNGSIGRVVSVAQDGERARSGRVYLAPDDRHLRVLPEEILRLSEAPPVRSLRPSADVLFRSAAQAYGRDVVGVVLTGMGDDGARGARAIKEAGGRVLAQSEESATIFGMPRAVIEAGLADEVLAPDEMARRLLLLCGRGEAS
ncbi:MAG TPA: chemotaxis-specific protein-glutamate methyltransferase CheB [Armatimonadota bacterium]|nr:chemotaxis-specific protein-glutamate methyltransferase CheB [Armatimonadota bacterium]